MSRKSSQGRPWARLRFETLERDGWRCTECGRAARLEVHHLKPLEHGGTDAPDNLAAICRCCHIERHRNDTPAEAAWRELVTELR